MPLDTLTLSVYLAPMAGIWFVYWLRRQERHRRDAALLHDSCEAGLTEPASLHPAIDPARCLGCATCVTACPEEDVLGLVGGKAALVQPTGCIGHGACKEACPQDAIRLVLGTRRRGVEVPVTSPDFETTVPGLFVAGELGGMGLIRNAITQGTQAVDAIAAAHSGANDPDVVDLIIVGAGPAGIAAALRAKEIGLRAITLEQESLGGTVAHYPRGKIVMTAPVDLPGYGRLSFREASKEQLLEIWLDVVDRMTLDVRAGERVTALRRSSRGFEVESDRGVFTAGAVLLCLGRRGTPRKLGIEGETLTKVVYRLVDPAQYVDQRILVVGGGDSALEAASALIDADARSVTLCYRGAAFSRAKKKNRLRIEALANEGRLDVFLDSSPARILEGTVIIETPGGDKEIANEVVIICAGGILPTAFLKDAGVDTQVLHGE